MKPMHGIILAIGLGIAGALFNFAYLTKMSGEFEVIEFVGIKDGTTISPGDRLTLADLEPVPIPMASVEELDKVAIRYSATEAIKTLTVWRLLTGPTLLFKDDLDPTLPRELDLEENEAIVGISVSPGTYVPSLVDPGDQVSFVISTSRINWPTPAVQPDAEQTDGADGAEEGTTVPPRPSSATRTIGKFTVTRVEPRPGTAANRMRSSRSNMIKIRFTVAEDGTPLDRKVQTLFDLLHSSSARVIAVIHYPLNR